jgi:hypothetical protein
MKKNRLPVIIILVLVFFIIFLVIKSKTNTIDNTSNQFAVQDTASITKIFLTDKNNNTVLLSRKDSSVWMVNDTFRASKDVVVLFLKTIMSLDVKQPVSKTGRELVMRYIKKYTGLTCSIELNGSPMKNLPKPTMWVARPRIIWEPICCSRTQRTLM